MQAQLEGGSGDLSLHDGDAHTEETPSLPPRPQQEGEHTDVTVQDVPNTHAQEHDSPDVAALRAMFPDFDTLVLQSVLDSVNGNQERAIDVLLGMNDPNYVSTPHASEGNAQDSLALDEQLARQLMLEDQEQRQRPRASGQSWPRREQLQNQAPEADRPPQQRQGHTDFQEFQQTVGRIAETGKRTFSSIVSKVKAKINEYDQNRQNNTSPSNAAPQWGDAPPTGLDRHTTQQTYAQGYYGHGSQSPPRATSRPVHAPEAERTDLINIEGYDLSPDTNAGTPVASPVPAGIPSSSTELSGRDLQATSAADPLPSPQSSDVSKPPRTLAGSPIDAAKLGLLPKRPVMLLTPQPAAAQPRHPDEDDEDDLEYVENPFEENR